MVNLRGALEVMCWLGKLSTKLRPAHQLRARKMAPPTPVSTAQFLVALGPTRYKNAGENIQPAGDSAPNNADQSIPPELPRTVGDFDDNANPMWSLHLGEAKSHDEARIHSLKDDMDSVLIFVRVCISIVFNSQAHALLSRPVYSLLPSLPFSSIALATFRSIRHSRWCSTSNRTLHYSLRSPSRLPLSPQTSPSHPLHFSHTISDRTHLISGSTYIGS